MSPLRVAASKKPTLSGRVLLEQTEKKIQETVLRLVQICSLPIHEVIVSLKLDEEFFCISRDHYLKRPDLLVAGRALFGDHSIEKEEIPSPLDVEKSAFLREVEEEAASDSITIKIVKRAHAIYAFSAGPEQGSSLLTSRQRIVEILQKTARRHGLSCLFSEQSFPGFHHPKKEILWALKTETGKDWLDPGFSELAFLILTSSISHALREHRLLLDSYVSHEKIDFHTHAIRFRPFSSDLSPYFPWTVVNAIFCDSLTLILDEIADAASRLQKKDEAALLSVVKPILHRHLVPENQHTNPSVSQSHFASLLERKSERAFQGLLNPEELRGIHDEKSQEYAKKSINSAQVMVDLSQGVVLPALHADLNRLRHTHSSSLDRMSSLHGQLTHNSHALVHSLEMMKDLGWEAKCQACDQLLSPQIQEAGHVLSILEKEMDASLWPFPHYEDMLLP